MLFWASKFPEIGDNYFEEIFNLNTAYPEAPMKLEDN